ncbi:methyltransferase family protein [Ruminiclostridium sufflavum DSM 19573]|uniref:Methyltransferase family protein n=1 Tax=Ruminiclostridium sufflavum DSM 19573 TaxID=1121337 RepID=A0A318XKQ9_9FIRM|nr:class I SAM-dependent methyltransferase [Ruminiclostridium sufflavum]PYG87770.1 methyltransferase family protein [Ruminiclostridium sufflavum DSM 19573]
MGFYEQISQYYDSIFPIGEEQIEFLKEAAGAPPKAVLDIACGTGGYSLELAGQGYAVTAADLDAEMIRQLRLKAEKGRYSIESIQSDMLELEGHISDKFDMVFCIGNSVVHLNSLLEIRSFIFSTRKYLKAGGKLVIQIINFDRILLRDIKGLPSIADEKTGLYFERSYFRNKQENALSFKTVLTVDGKSFENEIPLYPLTEDELVQAVRDAGFETIKPYGDFKGSAFDKCNSYMLVICAE